MKQDILHLRQSYINISSLRHMHVISIRYIVRLHLSVKGSSYTSYIRTLEKLERMLGMLSGAAGSTSHKTGESIPRYLAKHT